MRLVSNVKMLKSCKSITVKVFSQAINVAICLSNIVCIAITQVHVCKMRICNSCVFPHVRGAKLQVHEFTCIQQNCVCILWSTHTWYTHLMFKLQLVCIIIIYSLHSKYNNLHKWVYYHIHKPNLFTFGHNFRIIMMV